MEGHEAAGFSVQPNLSTSEFTDPLLLKIESVQINEISCWVVIGGTENLQPLVPPCDML